MTSIKVIKLNFGVILFLVLLTPLISWGADYYVSTNGSGTTCSSGLPCALSYGVNTKATAGDTVYLHNGTYYQQLQVTRSGTSGSPITIKALNDGQAIIDRQGASGGVCVVSGRSYITIEGIQCKNGGASGTTDVVAIWNSSNIILRKVSAHNDNSTYYGPLFGVANTNNLLIEDSISTGSGRNLYNLYNTNYVTMRRNYGKFVTSGRWCGGSMNAVQVYGSNNTILENNFFSPGTAAGGCTMGIGTWANYYNTSTDNNQFLGNIMIGAWDIWPLDDSSDTYIIYNNTFRNNVVIGTRYGLRSQSGSRTTATNNTFANIGITGTILTYRTPHQFNEAGFMNSLTLTNNSYVGGAQTAIYEGSGTYIENLTNTYNNVYGVGTSHGGSATSGAGDKTLNPYYDTATYGNGAYLMVPSALQGQGESGADIGAEALYRYQNGVKTTAPLWPWPMEDRICAETGFSVTYESHNGCTGGLWKTLNSVYSSNSAPPITTACSDGIDNDSDGYVDLNDIGCTASSDNSEADPIVNSTLTALKTLSPLIINGDLSENVWNLTNYVNFSNPYRSDNEINVYALWDDNNLYFAYEVTDANLESLDTILYADDGAEIYLDTQNNKTASMDSNDYHFTANINDIVSNSGIVAKTASTPNGYIMEIAIPWNVINTLPSPDKIIGLLLGNNDRDYGQGVQFDWLDLIETGSYSRPNLWGEVVISDYEIGSVDATPPSPPTGLTIASN